MVLVNRNFFLLWTGQLISQLGDRFYSIALAWWVLEKTNSPAIMGLFLAASVLPELIFGLAAGGFIDRWNRKSILIVSDVFRGLTVLALAFLSALGYLEIWHIFMAGVIISLSSAFFDPTVMAVIPKLVSQEDLPRANSLSQMISGLATVAGPVLGATLVALLGYKAVFIINGLSYLASALLEAFITLHFTQSDAGEHQLLLKIKEGFKFIFDNKTVRIILLVIGVVHIFYGSLAVAMPFLASTITGSGIKNLGYLETAMGVGMILGAMVVGRQKLNHMRGGHLFMIILAAGLCFALLGAVNSLGIVVRGPYIGILLFIGMAASVASVYWRSLLQIHVPNEMAGRVFSVSTMIADVSLPVSFVVFGFVLKGYSMTVTVTICGLSLMIIGAALLLKYRRLV
ncbi:MAG: MFS transporter [Bacillota bacterium]